MVRLRTIAGEQVLTGVSFYTTKDVSHLSLFIVKVISVNTKLVSYLYLLIFEHNLLIIRQLI